MTLASIPISESQNDQIILQTVNLLFLLIPDKLVTVGGESDESDNWLSRQEGMT